MALSQCMYNSYVQKYTQMVLLVVRYVQLFWKAGWKNWASSQQRFDIIYNINFITLFSAILRMQELRRHLSDLFTLQHFLNCFAVFFNSTIAAKHGSGR